LLLLQVPPLTASVKVVVAPVQIVVVPAIVPADGAAFTAIAFVALVEPQVPVIV
jgi:hypothetical protein